MPPAGNLPSGRPEVQPQVPLPSLPLLLIKAEDFASDDDQFTNNPDLSLDEEGELSEVLSQGPDREDLTDPDQELSSEQTYRETLCGVRSFMCWDQVPEFDSSSSAQDDNPLPVPSHIFPVKCR